MPKSCIGTQKCSVAPQRQPFLFGIVEDNLRVPSLTLFYRRVFHALPPNLLPSDCTLVSLDSLGIPPYSSTGGIPSMGRVDYSKISIARIKNKFKHFLKKKIILTPTLKNGRLMG